MRTTILNLFGGPGAGKSGTAGLLFGHMKFKEAFSVELVTERAKELSYEGTLRFADQLELLAEQRRRLSRLVGKVEIVINDSPLLLTLAYRPEGYLPSYDGLALEAFKSFRNLNVHVIRPDGIPYENYGRDQDEIQSVEKCQLVRSILQQHGVPHIEVSSGFDAIEPILLYIKSHHGC